MEQEKIKAFSERIHSTIEKDIKVIEEIQKRYLSLMDVGIGIVSINDVVEDAFDKLKEVLIANYNNYMAVIKTLQKIWDMRIKKG